MGEKDVKKNFQVDADDQKLINRFAQLHQKYIEIKGRLEDLKKDLQDISDASDELLLLDDADALTIPFCLGSAFIHMGQDTANIKLDELKQRLEKKVKVLGDTQTKVNDEMTHLKKILYGKFGDSINLETDKDV